MNVLVFNEQIAGTTDNPSSLPLGFTSFEVPNQPIDNLYFDTKTLKVLEKPRIPSPNAFWLVDHWVTPTETVQVALSKITQHEAASVV